MCIVLLSMKRYFCKGDEKYRRVLRHMQQGESNFRTLGIQRERESREGDWRGGMDDVFSV